MEIAIRTSDDPNDNGLDFAKRLREQKAWLLDIRDADKADGLSLDEATGLIHLIDHIQDTMVSDCGMTEEEVFGEGWDDEEEE